VKRLLVVEDHPWVLQTLCRALRTHGAHIESATTLRTARERIAADDPFDVVICEQHLSDGTALELLGWLRWQQHIPVPFLLIARSDRLRSPFSHDVTILAPPFGTDRLLASLNSLLRHETNGIIARQIPFAGEPR